MRSTERYCYLRNGAFYWRWPEKVWVLDRSLATVFAEWQRAGGPFGTTWRKTMRWQRAGKKASDTQHTGVQKPMLRTDPKEGYNENLLFR